MYLDQGQHLGAQRYGLLCRGDPVVDGRLQIGPQSSITEYRVTRVASTAELEARFDMKVDTR